MDTVQAVPGRSRRARAALLAAVLALGGLALAGVAPADAATRAAKDTKAAKVADGEMTWALSAYVLTPNPATLSVSEVHEAEAPATFTAGTGWTFTDGTGTYDRKTGAITVEFPGSISFGNTSRGNYSFRLADPTFELDGDGDGTLTADLSVRPAGATAFAPATRVAVVDITGAEPTKAKRSVEVVATPTSFTPALVAAAGDLAAHFQATGSANDATKPPAPITVTFDYRLRRS